jgi:acetolactate synthase-1/2/3 large subunit
MKVRGGKLIVRALEDEGVRFTFGIPGTHNIELYDALQDSDSIEPILVTDEQAASFMAIGVSLTSDQVGVLNVVPGAGVTHAMSGIAEAFMDQVPLVVIACGIRNDTSRAFQLHDIDQLAMLRPITKGTFHAGRADEIYPMIRRAFQLARRGVPGPVAVEIPANLLILSQEISGFDFEPDPEAEVSPAVDLLERAAQMLGQSQLPTLYLGAGAAGAGNLLVDLAEQIGAPVTTTIQGKGVFPESHPLWLWNGFGAQAPKFVRSIMDRCDCLLAIGCRFAEVGTASYGIEPPPNLIHVDLDPEVFDRNFPAALAIQADARIFVRNLLALISGERPWPELAEEIRHGHEAVRAHQLGQRSDSRVTPAALFAALQRHCRPDTVYSTDSGIGTFLAMENLRIERPGRFIAPVDFSCMGYSVPAAIGGAFVNQDRDLIALAGDGALLMTGLELLTAATYKAAPLVCVLRDGKLGQIAQLQKVPLNRQTCTVLPDYRVEDLARTVGCRYFRVLRDTELDSLLPAMLELTRSGEPVMAEIVIDYSRKTYFTEGVLQTVFRRLPWGDRVRMLWRALSRRALGRN